MSAKSRSRRGASLRRCSANSGDMDREVEVSCTVNGNPVRKRVPVRRNLVDFLRDDLGLTGSHVGCEHGVCGACTVRVDGVVVRGCLMLAAQCDGMRVETIEGVSDAG